MNSGRFFPFFVLFFLFFLNVSLNVSEVYAMPTLESVEKLVSEDKLSAALDQAKIILEEARKKSDTALWTKALLKIVQLQMGLSQVQTAVAFLREQGWPDDPQSKVLLHLVYAQALIQYFQQYGWEIRQREKTRPQSGEGGNSSSTVPPLEKMSVSQISREIRQSFDALMEYSALLEKPFPRDYEAYLEAPRGPDGIFPTLRDTVVSVLGGHLMDTSWWNPEEEALVHQLPLEKIAAAAFPRSRRIPAASSEEHPLMILASWMGEHREFHRSHKRQEAALETHYDLLEKLHSALGGGGSGNGSEDDEDKQIIKEELLRLQEKSRRNPWWSRGQALLAGFLREKNPMAAVQAAREGLSAYPGSLGAQRCEFLLRQIEQPAYELQFMKVDGPNRSSFTVRYKNLKTLYFRAYAVDIPKALEGLLPHHPLGFKDYEERRLYYRKKPLMEWKEELPLHQDYSFHRVHLVPPLKAPGTYLIFSSLGPSFEEEGNAIFFNPFLLSDLLLLTRSLEKETPPPGAMETRVIHGDSGKPLAGIPVTLYRYRYEDKAKAVETRKTDGAGYATFSLPTKGGTGAGAGASAGGWNYFFLAQKGEHFAYDMRSGFFQGYPHSPSPAKGAFLFTDRSLYRPNQKIRWKVATYREKSSSEKGAGEFTAAASGETLDISLKDMNDQVVSSLKVTTNSFGTASGEFLIPEGRALGQWRITAGPYPASAAIQVEEYKRPTMEVSLDKPKGNRNLRLNQKVQVTGKALYFFGQPVISGTVRWRVVRREMAPWPFWFFGGRGKGGGLAFLPSQEPPLAVASGKTSLDARGTGTFSLEFIPGADERKSQSQPHLSYQYEIEAEVTNEEGETQTALSSLRIGFETHEVRIQSSQNFFLPEDKDSERPKFDLLLRSLEGTPHGGQGKVQVFRLKAPAKTPLPSELPTEETPPAKRARFETAFEWEGIVKNWPTGELIKEEKITFSPDSGQAAFTPGALTEEGAYRIVVQVDSSSFQKDFLVGRAPLPLVLLPQQGTGVPGKSLRFLVHSGLSDQSLTLNLYRRGKLVSRRQLTSGTSGTVDIPLTQDDRGGFTATLTAVRDYQVLHQEASVEVPWADKELQVSFQSFRNKLEPGQKEKIKVVVKDSQGKNLTAKTAEVLGLLYDRSLEALLPHVFPSPLSVYPSGIGAPVIHTTQGLNWGNWVNGQFPPLPTWPELSGGYFKFLSSYGIGGPGVRGGMMFAAKSIAAGEAGEAGGGSPASADMAMEKAKPAAPTAAPTTLRTQFTETALWAPHLLLEKDGTAALEWQMPDSVTSWKLVALALTRDFRSGRAEEQLETSKALMVRPSFPRFLREGDEALLQVSLNNTSERDMKGELTISLVRPFSEEPEKDVSESFGWKKNDTRKSFSLRKSSALTLEFPLKAPAGLLSTYAIRVEARSGDHRDGELRPFPLLPGRVHLTQSRFAALKNKSTRELSFPEMKASPVADPGLIHEKLVITLEAQLFQGVLKSLPYLVHYPYECSEQILNRFVSTSILSSLYKKHEGLARRKSPWEKFLKEDDPNQRTLMEESPWLREAGGEESPGTTLLNLLDPKVAARMRDEALTRLKKIQLPSGAFPWFEGGAPDPYMTLYLLLGLSRALEFEAAATADLKMITVKGWNYLKDWLDRDLKQMIADKCCFEWITLFNYVLSSFPDSSWTGGSFDLPYRTRLLDFSATHWKNHSPLLKGFLSLTLHRMERKEEARKVWDSVMDSAKTTEDQGTFWAPEDRSWLWYNDHILTHAFALRTQMELFPQDKQRPEGLVQWLFLNKKLNHWKSTRATAEVIYSLAKYLDLTSQWGQKEEILVDTGTEKSRFLFSPDADSRSEAPAKTHIVIPGNKIDPQKNASIRVEKTTPGLAFAQANWHFSTEKLPEKPEGDFFSVTRKFFKREFKGKEWILSPLEEGTPLQVGDQVEVQLSLRTKHEAEYIHLRDPRGAGFEPEGALSSHKWDLGITWYEEIRDSATHFFFSRLPVGEFPFKYRMRVRMAGLFRVGPATLESLYAPEFNAYSSGQVLRVVPAERPPEK